ncbi:histidine phosphatase family protein [Pseudonocardia sp. HH130629-09]|uniref:histidine phosphatase family protein n=1 Tax=Pseudonocardia sp. HH130629-09 TaxID=1641402 RepID=UPI0006CB4DA9|nr:histidine phosphatase family protein [Pseudonocardia sp. HH130629-09]ALE82479.1 hypothetical protein XF36_04410 [Pseudonocardia sp. HH130629-09]
MTFVVHAATTATATAAFAVDAPLDQRWIAALTDAAPRVPRHDHSRHGPDPASSETHSGLGLSGRSDDDLCPWDPGQWTGRTLDDIAEADPQGLHAWLTDPDSTPHAGESLTALIERVRRVLASMPPGHTIAVAGAAIARAAVVTTMGAPPSAFWRIDAAPLTVTDLRGGTDRWTVRCTGRPLDES